MVIKLCLATQAAAITQPPVAGALIGNKTGGNNTANGVEALFQNSSGSNNTANGASALSNNNTGSLNTADGASALLNNTTGKHNIALGDSAGANLATGDNNICIGNAGVLAEAKTIRIGTVGTHTDTFIAGIYKETVPKGLDVVVDSDGHLGTKGSSERFKDAIKPMDKASEAILSLKPVTFRYKHKFDPEGIPQFGLVAEDVAKVNPDLGGAR
jgi:trimeric autotransporter adhesin